MRFFSPTFYITLFIPLGALAAPTRLVDQAPVTITQLRNGRQLVDFGSDSTVKITLNGSTPFCGVAVEGWKGKLQPEQITRRSAFLTAWDDEAASFTCSDPLLNQISHYVSDSDIQNARDTFNHLMKSPTWPAEWTSHLIFMAHADFKPTGDKVWLSACYESLKSKLLYTRARPVGLVLSNDKQVKRDDIVDWPQAEHDGYLFTPLIPW